MTNPPNDATTQSATKSPGSSGTVRFALLVAGVVVGVAVVFSLMVFGLAFVGQTLGWFGTGNSTASETAPAAAEPATEDSSAAEPTPMTAEEVTAQDDVVCETVIDFLSDPDPTETSESVAEFLDKQADAAGSQDLTDLLRQMATQTRNEDYEDMTAFDTFPNFCF